jgi:hypothetical protein
MGHTIANLETGQVEFEIKVVNPSDKDIGYFDFRVFDDATNKGLDYYSPVKFNKINETENMNVDTILMGESESRFPIILPTEHGIFPAHQETVLAVVIVPQSSLRNISFVFKIARKKRFSLKKRGGYIYSKFDSYLGDVSINWKDKPDFYSMKRKLDEIRKNENN